MIETMLETEISVNRTSVAVKKEGFTVRAVGNETLILDTNGTSIHAADEVGSFIFSRIDDVKTLSAILEEIMEAYEVDEKTAETDLYGFIGELVSRKIVEIR